MRWDEYVEDATAAIASRQRARDVRGELRDHLESSVESLMAAGMERDKAEEEAMRRLGPVDLLARQFRRHYRAWAPLWPAAAAIAGAVAAATCFGLRETAGGALLAAWTLVWSALHARSFVAVWRQPWSLPRREALLSRLQAARPFAGAGLVAAPCIVASTRLVGAIGPVAVLLAAAVVAWAWLAALHMVGPGDEDIAYPFGSGVSAVVVAAAGSLASPFLPGGLAIPLLGAAIYFTGTRGLWWLHRHRQQQESEGRIPLAVEVGPPS